MSNGQVTISWSAPDNGGSDIISYSIVIAKADTVTYLETTSCNGALSSIITARSCTIDSSVINGSPYLVDWGSSVWAKVSARNKYDTSGYSPAGNGATIITVPNAPTSLVSTAITTTSI